ncbi:MAG: penicillin acylase family protein [Myxococcales bacterium]|nr:penicillin acylase family protein [Myxococcales bacterium]
MKFLHQLLDLARDARFFAPIRPFRPKTPKLDGLSRPVRVFRDLYGVSHIVAESEDDAFLLFGYVMARDRLFQMELFRRAFGGYLSEWLGERKLGDGEGQALFEGKTTIDLDLFMRAIDLEGVAERSLALVSARSQRLLEQFSAGVNQYIARLGRLRKPLEYTILGARPRPWRPVDSVLIGKGMAFQQEHAWKVLLGLEFIRSSAGVPDSIADWLWPTSDKTAICRYAPAENAAEAASAKGADGIAGAETAEGAEDAGATEGAGTADGAVRSAGVVGAAADIGDLAALQHAASRFIGFGAGPFGSNAWVVAPQKTATASAHLCNDMHLPLTAPSLMWQFHLRCPTYDVIGATFPGIPVALCGHNREIAWGFTSGKCHASDLVELEPADTTGRSIDSTDAGRYHSPRGPLPLRARRVEIEVRGRKKPVVRTLRNAHFGPVLSDVVSLPQPPHRPPQRARLLAFRWTGLEPAADLDAFLDLNRASDWTSFNAAASRLVAPTMGGVFADRAGNIGYHVVGRVPLRPEPPSRSPIDVARADRDWQTTIPYDELPQLYNPREGFVGTANNRHVGDGYPYPLGDFFEPSYRWQRIVEVLGAKAKLDVDDHRKLHADTRSLHALRFVERVLRPLVGRALPRHAGRILDLCLEWDGHYRVNSHGAAAYRVFFDRMMRRNFEQRLGRATTRVLEEILRIVHLPIPSEHPIPPLPFGEANVAELVALLEETNDELRKRLGSDREGWTWGALHTLTHRHPFDAIPAIGPLFSIGPVPSPGEALTVNMGAHDFRRPFAQAHGAAVRMIVNLGDLDDCYWVINSGASGDVTSKNYSDQAPLWLRGQYLRMHFSDAAIEALPCRTYLPRTAS